MENNKETLPQSSGKPQPIQQNPAPVQPTIPTAGPQQAPVQEPKGPGNKMLLWFIIGIVAIVVIVGGIYFILSRQQSSESTKEASVVQTPVPSPQENLEGDLNNINVDNSAPGSDFAPVDQDLQQL